jgi:hypothetical protein
LAWVHERIFAGGGANIPSTWVQFSSQMGIQTVIHLSSPTPATFHGSPPARFLWLDIEQEEEADHGVRALCGRFVLDALNRGGGVLLHSAHGRHRTRWVYVAYLIYAGRQVRAALKLAEQKPWQAPYHTDRKQWSDFKNYLSGLPPFASAS